jgi:SsrA-binding protein
MSVEIKNKRAAYKYQLSDEFTAGISLLGTEIKSIRNGKAGIADAYCRFVGDELFVFNMYIQEYEKGTHTNHEPRRMRKLLLNRSELNKIHRKVKNDGVTIVPLLLYISEGGYAKLKIAIAKGKKLHDKRDDLKKKDHRREIQRSNKVR